MQMVSSPGPKEKSHAVSPRIDRTRVPEVIEPALLVHAYRQGIFPMALEDNEIGWFSPDPRGVLPLDQVHVPARLARVIRSGRFEVAIDRDFEGVMRACAADREDGTWISEEIIESYVELHRLGMAHSIEAWRAGKLVGGLYGVHLGGAFFGESMFHHETDASKVALIALVTRMRERGLSLLDIQWVTPHLAQFGAMEVPREEYLARLSQVIDQPRTFV
jgi:leucyl/phenylalanyl-tRNA--protein transferase